MTNDITVSLISLLGTLGGSFLGILTSQKLSNYRIGQLEEKVNKHNNLIERMYIVEERTKENTRRIDDLEKNESDS